MGLLSAAKQSESKVEKVKPSKGCDWTYGVHEGSDVGSDITEFLKLQAEKKALEGRAAIFKSRLTREANERLVAHLVNTGTLPSTPTRLVNGSGESVTYVVQDRTGSKTIDDTTLGLLEDLLGPEVAHGLVADEGEFSLNRDIMSKSGVAEVVEQTLDRAFSGIKFSDKEARLVKKAVAALEKAIPSEKLGQVQSALFGVVSTGQIGQDDVNALFSYKRVRHLRPTVIATMSQVCGGVREKIVEFLDIIGGACVRYIKD